jgi:hypothetical protein
LGASGETQKDGQEGEPFVQVHDAEIGSMTLGSLFFTLPTRVLTSQWIMPSEGCTATRSATRAYERYLRGEATGDEWLVRCRFSENHWQSFPFFLDLSEQPGLNRGGCPLSLRNIMGEAAGLEDHGPQLGDAAATGIVEMHKRKAGPRHRILQKRDRRSRGQAMLAAQVQKSTDKAMAAVSVVITAARPVAVVGEKLEH